MIISYAFLVKRYLRKNNRSEVETLLAGRVWYGRSMVIIFSRLRIFQSSAAMPNRSDEAVLRTPVTKKPCLRYIADLYKIGFYCFIGAACQKCWEPKQDLV